jgi:very-short-patch-repair endonuclease
VEVPVEHRLEETRRRLLDLSRANRLLNHRSTGQRTLQIVDELPAEVYRILVEQGQAMQFRSSEEAPPERADALTAGDAGEDESQDAPSPDGNDEDGGADLPLAPVEPKAARHTDRHLQTLLAGDKLQTRLVYMAREAASAQQEQGYNILYLTLGIVRWQEGPGQGPASNAPLLFIPVELQRKNVQSRHSLQLFDDEIVTNPCLAELCQRQFQFELPQFDPEGDTDVEIYLERVRSQIAGMSGWEMLPEIHLGLFSFSKLLMYRDLDPRNWPAHAPLVDHPLLRQMAGVESEEGAGGGNGAVVDPAKLDEIPPNECFQVVDADSSQQAAILAAKGGVSLVIDGPPGTGKSQTITNIIAECLAEGKSVLFVAEKSAALDVVKRRLENVGLGDFVLELHSRKSSKKVVLQELSRVLSNRRASLQAAEVDADELQRVRSQLNAYERELHEPLGAVAISPFEAIARAVALADEPEASAEVPQVLEWTSGQVSEAEEMLSRLDQRLARVGDVSNHPWRGAGIISSGLRSRQAVQQSCRDLMAALAMLEQRRTTLAGLLGAQSTATTESSQRMVEDAQTLLAALKLLPTSLADERWNGLSPALQQWLNLGLERERIKSDWLPRIREEAELQNWKDVLRRRDRHKGSVLRFLRLSWYRDGKRLRQFMREAKLPPVPEQLSLLQLLVRSRELRDQIESQAPQFMDLFGAHWSGPDSDWPALRKFAESAVAVRQLILRQAVAQAAAQRLIEAEDRAELQTAANELQESLSEAETAWQRWLEAIGSDEKQWLGQPLQQADLVDVQRRLQPLPELVDQLVDWVDLRQSVQECTAGRLASFTKWSLSSAGAPARGRLTGTFKRHFYRLWIDAAFAQRPALARFRGEEHDALVDRFRHLDQKWLKASRHRLSALIAAKRPDINHSAHRHSKLGILQAEIRKKTRHMPLRKLLASIGDVVQAVKPCFMMSPISVAQFLAPGGLMFDVVIFDEASQVEPADGYGAIARGRQLLLVGDEKQLPPTNFFAKIDQETVMEEDDDPRVRATDLESILSLGIVRLRHRPPLRWHYRSRHASLIEFSNQKLYDGLLRIFPSPHTDCSEMGISFRFVENGIYHRGAGRHNPVEARTVAEAVIAHARDCPELTLGVGTLNLPQQQAIEDEVERLRRELNDPQIERYFAMHEEEPFFVKNLENIQGDERDVIYISVGYGRDPAGRFHASFGPLNSDGGWRRLNVLVTRARRRCIVYGSIRSDDINLGANAALGVVALKEYLYAAEHGSIPVLAAPGGEHHSPFEADVGRLLTQHGWEVHAQVGAAGFAVDLGVVDPQRPGRYLLGIECDGATYHSSPTARDRDRLRQSVLEGLGWAIHRVWSTDWFNRREQTLKRLLRRLEQCIEESRAPDTVDAAKAPSDEPEVMEESREGAGSDVDEDPPAEANAPETDAPEANAVSTVTDALPDGVVTYQRFSGPAQGDRDRLMATSPLDLAGLIGQIVEQEGPVHVEQVLRTVAELYGTRVSARVRDAVDRALSAGGAHSLFTRAGDFLQTETQNGAAVRWRGDSAAVTDADQIPPQEFEAAIALVLAKEFGLGPDSLVQSTIRLMGFRRASPKLRQAVEAALARMMESNKVAVDGAGFLVLQQAFHQTEPDRRQ